MPVPDQSSAAERRARMLTAIEQRGFVRVIDLSRQFGVSAVTVRADLDALEAEAHVRRVRGGAMPAAAVPELQERPYEAGLETLGEDKRSIAARAVEEVRSGMSVLLDVGTTTAAVARELLRREDLEDLTVITNGLRIALLLEPAVPRLQVVVTGGTLRPLQHSLVAPLADGLLARLHTDLALIGCNGVDARAGVTNINLPEAEVKRAMIAAAARTVVVADGSKVGRIHLGQVARAGDVDLLVTTASAPAEALAELRAVDGLRTVVVSGWGQ
ncbi:DeoR/GlpR family DNA-binding transcription regulator [Nocardioides sp. BP30]|uniref:DeoR/GlpR family DNA-binding transcription regulator n=1 Tax=Nocardioides sp. BP30 TaxID=3036374 RepID=UPI0024696422|nr:DeoR/GlpR family DNA-binding transcription regulator [Nocardioides sp. BP30]WGL51392.1 DeoR/GlpR family DNA-binding transcription regulator [Nocardioides sp. BP30]